MKRDFMARAAVSLGLAVLLLCPVAGLAASASNLNWYRCNTHTHTSAPPGSDANETPERVVEWYRANGYRCIVITDHEFHTEVDSLNRKHGGDFLVLRGQEITQMVADPKHPGGVRHAHVNGINTKQLIMPLRPQNAESREGLLKYAASEPIAKTFERNVSEIRLAGGLPQVNHPNLVWSVRPEDLLPLKGPYLLEIWNAFPTSNNLGGTDENGASNLSTEGLWDALLTRGAVAWGVASDDGHEYRALHDRESPTPGKAWIVIQAASLTESAVMESLSEGRFYASTGIELESYSVEDAGVSMKIKPSREWSPAIVPTARYTTRFIGDGGRILAEVPGRSPQYRFKGDERYVRAAIVDSDGRRAWTQPVLRK